MSNICQIRSVRLECADSRLFLYTYLEWGRAMKSKKTLSLLFGILLTSTAFANTTDLGSVTLHFTEQNMHNAPQLTFYYGGKFDLAPGYFSQEINLSNGTKIVL